MDRSKNKMPIDMLEPEDVIWYKNQWRIVELVRPLGIKRLNVLVITLLDGSLRQTLWVKSNKEFTIM